MLARGLVLAVVFPVLAAASGSACSSEDQRSASWEYISPALFQPNCATVSCHSRAAAAAGLDFSDPERGYTSLTGLEVSVPDPTGPAAGGANLRPLVTPFVPAQSRVVNMLRARAAPRMPPDRPLAEVDIRLVEQWILNGATRSVGGGVDARVVDAGAESRDADQDGREGGLPAGDGSSEQPADGRSDSSDAPASDRPGERP